jgi:hypothetical protein
MNNFQDTFKNNGIWVVIKGKYFDTRLLSPNRNMKATFSRITAINDAYIASPPNLGLGFL